MRSSSGAGDAFSSVDSCSSMDSTDQELVSYGILYMSRPEREKKASICFRNSRGDIETTDTDVSPGKISDLSAKGHIVFNGHQSVGTLNGGRVILFGIRNRHTNPVHPNFGLKLFIAVPTTWKWTLNEVHEILKGQQA